MSVRDPRATLRQIQDAAKRAQEICSERSIQAMPDDWLAAAALERFMEIMGEGVKRLPPALRDRYPAVPWREIAGTRDHLSHGYDNVDHLVLWGAVQKDIPLLLATIDRMLTELDLDAK
ncbi:MAG: DUF86 domain-containing protein [Opitutaceae bacterium]|nr:DUF86 domain-containing protein [Opitutaceae bacterium]